MVFLHELYTNDMNDFYHLPYQVILFQGFFVNFCGNIMMHFFLPLVRGVISRGGYHNHFLPQREGQLERG